MKCEICTLDLTEEEVNLDKGICYFCIYDNGIRIQQTSGQKVTIPSPETFGRTRAALKEHLDARSSLRIEAHKSLGRLTNAETPATPTHKLPFTKAERKAFLKKFGYDPGIPPKLTIVRSDKSKRDQAQLSFSISEHVDEESVAVLKNVLNEWVEMLVRLLAFGTKSGKPIEEIFFGRSNKGPGGGLTGEY